MEIVPKQMVLTVTEEESVEQQVALSSMEEEVVEAPTTSVS